MSGSGFPSWLPASAGHVEEKDAQATLRKLQRCQMHVPLLQRSLQTVYIETAVASAAAASGKGRCSLAALQIANCSMLCAPACTHICHVQLDYTGHLYTGSAMHCHQGHDTAHHHCRAQLYN